MVATPEGKEPTTFELKSAKPLKENEGTLIPKDEESLEEQAAAYHEDDHWELLVTDNSNVQAAAAPPTEFGGTHAEIINNNKGRNKEGK